MHSGETARARVCLRCYESYLHFRRAAVGNARWLFSKAVVGACLFMFLKQRWTARVRVFFEGGGSLSSFFIPEVFWRVFLRFLGGFLSAEVCLYNAWKGKRGRRNEEREKRGACAGVDSARVLRW